MKRLAGAPVSDRALHIDIVRGVAVFGLLWSNLNAGGYRGELTTADEMARWATTVFGAGKFFTLFSLLFGVTLAMQVAHADAGAQPIVRRWLRRMLVLFAIGWAHAIFFWPGDILRDYAVAGVALLLFHRASTRVVLFAALVAFVLAGNRESLSVVVTRATEGSVEAVERREEPDAAQLARRRALGEAQRSGSYGDVVRARLQVFPREELREISLPAGPLNGISPWYLALFLVGLVLGRQGVVQHPERHGTALRALLAVGLAVGLPLNIHLAATPAWLSGHWAYWPLAILARLALSLGYLGGLLLLLQRRRWLQRLRWLGPVGRLGLTNYIAQTAFLTFVKFNYGLGLEPVLGWFECLVIAVAFYVVQVAWSNWWLRRFSHGPVEWIWRQFSSGVARPLRPPAVEAA